jgi:hypothetical protein
LVQGTITLVITKVYVRFVCSHKSTALADQMSNEDLTETMDDALEEVEMALEETMLRATREELLALATQLGVETVTDTMRKPTIIKHLRKFCETNMKEDPKDTYAFYKEMIRALQISMREEGVSARRRVDQQSPETSETKMGTASAADTNLAADATSQLAAALQSLLLPRGGASTSSSLYKLPLKIVGVIGETGKGITYTNLVSQINDARGSGYKDEEILRAVKKAVAPSSHLRAYFDTDTSLTLAKMLGMLRDFFREKTANELFGELGSICQSPQETPTDFLIRSFQLRQKVLAASKVEDDMYADQLVYSTFCRSVRTGIINDQIRAHMKQFLDPKQPTKTTDEELLKQMNLCSSEIDEIQNKTRKSRKVTISESRVVQHEDLSPILEGLNLLRQQMDELRESRNRSPAQASGRAYSPAPGRKNICRRCEGNGTAVCRHCFNCGDETHYSRSCTKQKNEKRL